MARSTVTTMKAKRRKNARRLLRRINLILCAVLLVLIGIALFLTERPALPPQETVPPTEQTATPTVQPTTRPTVPPTTVPEPADTDMVRVLDYIPDIRIDLKYATKDNFTGKVIYDFADAYLRYGTVKKLARVQAALAAQGMGLKIWDAYRPTAAQFVLWEVCPDPTYVSNPITGFSSHSRGNTVDITLVYADGREVTMPTGFDNFTTLANRDYSDCPKEAADNALLLENLMKENGFTPYFGEWWHFSDSEKYDVSDFVIPNRKTA